MNFLQALEYLLKGRRIKPANSTYRDQWICYGEDGKLHYGDAKGAIFPIDLHLIGGKWLVEEPSAVVYRDKLFDAMVEVFSTRNMTPSREAYEAVVDLVGLKDGA